MKTEKDNTSSTNVNLQIKLTEIFLSEAKFWDRQHSCFLTGRFCFPASERKHRAIEFGRFKQVLAGRNLYSSADSNMPSMPLPLEAKGLIFDCDGTLLDTMPLHWSAWCAICSETGLKFNKESFYALAGVPGREIIRELANKQGISLDPIEVYARKRAFFLNGLKSVKIIPCVVRFALEARRIGIPTAVASGSCRSQVEKGKLIIFINCFEKLL